MTAKKATKKPTTKTAAASAAEAKKAARIAKTNATKAKAEAASARVAKLGGGHAAGFMNFVRQQGVIGLAVGLAIGTAAGASVKAIVENFVNPVITLIVGSQEALLMAKWTVTIGDRSAEFGWGAVLSSLITLTATALLIYIVIHGAKLDRVDKAK